MNRISFYSCKRLRGIKSQIQRQIDTSDPSHGSSRQQQRTSRDIDPRKRSRMVSGAR